MKIKHFNQLSLLSGLVGILLLLSGQSAHAELLQVSPQLMDASKTPELTLDLLPSEVGTDIPITLELTPDSVVSDVGTVPVPGTVETSAVSLQTDVLTAQATDPAPLTTPETTSPVGQTVTPGRATRSGPSYVAVAGNIGFGGRTALGRGNFAITSKIGLTNYFSARPGLVVGRSPTILLPVTFDFPVGPTIADRFRIAPFVGGGLAISTRGGSAVRALAMGGVDVPLGDRFTATASANAAFFRRPEIGVILGVGYNF